MSISPNQKMVNLSRPSFLPSFYFFFSSSYVFADEEDVVDSDFDIPEDEPAEDNGDDEYAGDEGDKVSLSFLPCFLNPAEII